MIEQFKKNWERILLDINGILNSRSLNVATSFDKDDLKQEAAIIFLQIIENNNFETFQEYEKYFKSVVKHELQEAIRVKGRDIKVPKKNRKQTCFMNRFNDEEIRTYEDSFDSSEDAENQIWELYQKNVNFLSKQNQDIIYEYLVFMLRHDDKTKFYEYMESKSLSRYKVDKAISKFEWLCRA